MTLPQGIIYDITPAPSVGPVLPVDLDRLNDGLGEFVREVQHCPVVLQLLLARLVDEQTSEKRRFGSGLAVIAWHPLVAVDRYGLARPKRDARMTEHGASLQA